MFALAFFASSDLQSLTGADGIIGMTHRIGRLLTVPQVCQGYNDKKRETIWLDENEEKKPTPIPADKSYSLCG